MIERLVGEVLLVQPKGLLLNVSGVGFGLVVPEGFIAEVGKTLEVWTALCWSESNGPTLFGFSCRLQKSVFLFLQECPKVGPQTALTILTKVLSSSGIQNAESSRSDLFQFLRAIGSANQDYLESVNGIGAKTAGALIANLAGHAEKLLASDLFIKIESNKTTGANTQLFVDVAKAMRQMGYTDKEIQAATHVLARSDERDFAKMVKIALKSVSGQ